MVTGVLADVRLRGDSAVLQYTEKFDRARLTPQGMRVSPEAIKASVKTLSAADRRAIRESIALVKEIGRAHV